MKRKALAVAVCAAMVGASALHLYLARFEAEVAGGAPRSIVMVTRDLALGEVVTRGSLAVRELPERYLEDRHIAADDLDRIVGTRATASVTSGASLLWTDLDIMQDGRTLSGLVRAGMRAFALPQRDVSFDGLLRPGDRVDVLFTADDEGAGTHTLLQNVLVLTVGGDLGRDDDHDDERRGGRATLSVTIAQAQLLAQAEGRGGLRLALRNPQDLVLAEGVAEARNADLVRAPRTEPEGETVHAR